MQTLLADWSQTAHFHATTFDIFLRVHEMKCEAPPSPKASKQGVGLSPLTFVRYLITDALIINSRAASESRG